MKNNIMLNCYILCLFSVSSTTFAATSTGNLSVTANIVSSCAANTTSTSTTPSNALLDFGTISSLGSNVDAQTASTGGTGVSVLCTSGTNWSITVGAGNNVNGTQRRMISSGGSQYLPYNLYSDAGRSNSIGINGQLATGTGNGTQQFVTIYGRIPAGTPLPAADKYNDLVALTITY